MGNTYEYTIGGSRVIPKTKWKIGNSKSIGRIQIDPSVTSRSDTTKKRSGDDSSRGNISELYQGKDETMIHKTWQGYMISKNRKGTRFPVYVKSIYKGKITWTTDYTYAKWYTEKTAKRLDAEIDEGIRNGEFDSDILADSDIQEVPEVEEVAEEQKPEADEPTTKLLASRNDKTLPLECINDLIKAYEELTHRTIEIVFKRNGTYRIFALSDEGNAIADWTNASDMVEHMTKFVEA